MDVDPPPVTHHLTNGPPSQGFGTFATNHMTVPPCSAPVAVACRQSPLQRLRHSDPRRRVPGVSSPPPSPVWFEGEAPREGPLPSLPLPSPPLSGTHRPPPLVFTKGHPLIPYFSMVIFGSSGKPSLGIFSEIPTLQVFPRLRFGCDVVVTGTYGGSAVCFLSAEVVSFVLQPYPPPHQVPTDGQVDQVCGRQTIGKSVAEPHSLFFSSTLCSPPIPFQRLSVVFLPG